MFKNRSNGTNLDMKNSEVKRLRREFRTARSECARLGAIIMELRIERDRIRAERDALKENYSELLSWGYEIARGGDG